MSNWLFLQPSIVQWNELWGLGAISLKIKSLLRWKSSIVKRPFKFNNFANFFTVNFNLISNSWSRMAGAIVYFKIPFSW